MIPRRLPDYAATFGLEALKRLDFIVDGKGGVAYLRPKKTPVPSPLSEQDRLVLVFVPGDAKSDDLVAHVLDGSSPYDAGIRNGDVLLKIDDRDVAQWRADPGDHWRINPDDPFIRPSTKNPVGTRTEMTLKRGGLELNATVDLKQIAILAPQTNPPPARPK